MTLGWNGCRGLRVKHTNYHHEHFVLLPQWQPFARLTSYSSIGLIFYIDLSRFSPFQVTAAKRVAAVMI